MAKGLGAFATGLLTGYTTGKKAQEDKEERELRMAKLKDERAMAEEFKALDSETKPSEGYVLTTPDGTRTVFADKKMAEEARAAFGGDSQLEAKFIVGGQQYDTPEAAEDAAAAANAPAAKLRKRADIALKYNRPDVADAYTKNYQNILEANRRDMQEQFLQAQATGDYDTVLNSVNARLRKSGAQASLVPNEQGGMTYQIVKNGQVVSAKPFANPQEFWDTMGQQVAQTPDNMLETWKVREGLKQQKRSLDIQEKGTDANIRQGDARLAQGARGLDIQERQVDAGIKHEGQRIGIAQGQLGVAQGTLGLQQAEANRPKVHSGVDASGDVTFGATQMTRDPKTGTWGLNVIGPQSIRGLKLPNPMANLFRPPEAPPDYEAVLRQALPPKNLGGTTPAPSKQPQNPLVNQIPR